VTTAVETHHRSNRRGHFAELAEDGNPAKPVQRWLTTGLLTVPPPAETSSRTAPTSRPSGCTWPSAAICARQPCAHCQPYAPVPVIGCSRCGEGPLVTGTDSDTDEVPERARDWLTQHGWSVDSDLLCLNHF